MVAHSSRQRLVFKISWENPVAAPTFFIALRIYACHRHEGVKLFAYSWLITVALPGYR